MAAGGGQNIRLAFLKSSFVLEVIEGLGGEGDEAFDADFAGSVFGEEHKFAADALVFVAFGDEEASHFGDFGVVLQNVNGDAAGDIAVDFKNVKIVKVANDFLPCAFDEFFGGNGVADERHDGADVFFHGAADGGIFVGVDHGADAVVGENFFDEGAVFASVENVRAANAVAAGAEAVFEF